MNVFPSSGNISGDVCTTLFGSTSILTLGKNQVYLCAVLSIIVLIIYVIFYNKIFAITFDEDFSKACGVKTENYNLLIAVIIAIVVVLAMNLVGSLLISALLIFPVISAMRLFTSFKYVSIVSAIISIFSAIMGIVISILLSTPVGSTIVGINVLIFIICSIFGKKKMKKIILFLILLVCISGCNKKEEPAIEPTEEVEEVKKETFDVDISFGSDTIAYATLENIKENPEDNSEITLVGVLDLFEEGKHSYCYIKDAVIE